VTNISEIGLYNRPTYCENAVNLLAPALAQISFTYFSIPLVFLSLKLDRQQLGMDMD